MSEPSLPKLFISYSWTTPTHERWVMDLAERLYEDNIDVILDKWDLKEGHDAYAFMESMVTNPEIKKVAMIFDLAYVKKADQRGGGVGTETQIITGEIYGKTSQDKFVAVVAENDEKGKAAIPVYYKGRIYIDLTDPERFESEYEKLVRWVCDKPLYVRPSQRKTPDFIADEAVRTLGNRSALKRVLGALRDGKSTATAALDEYLSSVVEGFEELRITTNSDDFDEKVVQSINHFLTTRDEVISVIQTVSKYQPSDENVKKIHRFFESLLRYYLPPADVKSYNPCDFDHFLFIVHELFLYTVAIFLEQEHFQQVGTFISTDFYVENRAKYGETPMCPVEEIDRNMQSLEHRNNRLQLRRKSLRSDFLHERNKSSSVRYEFLAQADLVIYIYTLSYQKGFWWPYTLLHIGQSRTPLPAFARSQSKKYFDGFRKSMGLNSVEEFRQMVSELISSGGRLQHHSYTGFSLEWVTGIQELGTKA